jgi:hypothetical protein
VARQVRFLPMAQKVINMILIEILQKLEPYTDFWIQFRWYRKLHKGRFEKWYLDSPICSEMWFAYNTELSGTRPSSLARGTPTIEIWV